MHCSNKATIITTKACRAEANTYIYMGPMSASKSFLQVLTITEVLQLKYTNWLTMANMLYTNMMDWFSGFSLQYNTKILRAGV